MPRRSRTSRPTTIDLFAGAGLFSQAFVSEGFEVIKAVELERAAAKTYASNLGDHIEVADVRSVEPRGSCDVLIAGPPCQGFSTLGKRDADDPRNYLSLEVLKWARTLQPKVIVIENVAAFLNAPVWKRLKAGFRRAGYEVTTSTYDAVDFGVPQLRSRSFTIAFRGRPPVIKPGNEVPTTVREAWQGLPETPDGVNGHVALSPTPIALARMRVIPPGGDKRDVMRRAPELAPKSWWTLGCHVTDVWGRMTWDSPSNTLRTEWVNPSKGRYIHPEQHRVISIREAARLHSIPDNWHFEGRPYQVARQIGNSVPTLMGRAIAKAIMRQLSG